MRQPADIEILREYFDLRDDGHLVWKKRIIGRIRVGSIAGCATKSGYRQVRIGGVVLYAHRIAFALKNGRWPNGDIRPGTLQELTQRHRTKRIAIKPTCVKGVGWDRSRGKWKASITHAGHNINLGRFDDFDLAELVYACAAQKYHGEFHALG